ncbi:MAG: hypothetical protein OXJ52_01095 [Oligoflexia bacterium]|nr:hypothetical protein [Oligoflexia bacterium]
MLYNYEKEYKEAYKKNICLAEQHLEAGKLDDKINKFCAFHGFNKDLVISEIKRSDIVKAKFAIDPKKQNFYEKKASEWIQSIKKIGDFENLPNRALWVINGGVMTKREKEKFGSVAQAKTIDFKWRYAGKIFYASHKYTKVSGGTQGSQYKDLRSFIVEANKSVQRDTFFIAIADGEFYQQTDKEAGVKRIQRLKNEANRKTVFSCAINELEQLLQDI